jgi:hypothetical protein
MNHVELVYGEEELEIEAAAEIATTLKYGSNISKEDFKECPEMLKDTSHPITHIFRVKRIYYCQKEYLGVIRDIGNGKHHYQAIVDFDLRHKYMRPGWIHPTLKGIIGRIESNRFKRDIGFKIVDMIKI